MYINTENYSFFFTTTLVPHFVELMVLPDMLVLLYDPLFCSCLKINYFFLSNLLHIVFSSSFLRLFANQFFSTKTVLLYLILSVINDIPAVLALSPTLYEENTLFSIIGSKNVFLIQDEISQFRHNFYFVILDKYLTK